MNMIFYKNITAPSYPIILCQIMLLLQEQWDVRYPQSCMIPLQWQTGDRSLCDSHKSTHTKGWQRVFAWRVMAPKFAVWRVIKPKLSAWRGTAHSKLMRDLLLYKCVMRDIYDFLLEFRDKETPFDLEGDQSLKVNRVLTKINKPWQPCHYFSGIFRPLLTYAWPLMSLIFVVGPNNRNTVGTS